MRIRQIIILILAVILLGGMFVFLRSRRQTVRVSPANNPSSTSSAQVSSSSAQQNSSEKVFNLVIKNKKVTSGGETLQASEGDNVTINITADELEEFHLHGYDKAVDIFPNKQVSLNFKADLTGRFPFELEKSKTDLGVLEVQPR